MPGTAVSERAANGSQLRKSKRFLCLWAKTQWVCEELRMCASPQTWFKAFKLMRIYEALTLCQAWCWVFWYCNELSVSGKAVSVFQVGWTHVPVILKQEGRSSLCLQVYWTRIMLPWREWTRFWHSEEWGIAESQRPPPGPMGWRWNPSCPPGLLSIFNPGRIYFMAQVLEPHCYQPADIFPSPINDWKTVCYREK